VTAEATAGTAALGTTDAITFRCSSAARDRDDPFFATAPPARRWLLVEHPGPWARNALAEGVFDPAVLQALDAFCRREGARFQLIRRTAARGAPTESRGRFAVVDTAPGREGVRWGRVDDPSELVAALDDLERSTEPSTEPVYLVCTHGKHDACCAVQGRPVAAVLAAAHPERTWETTHTGGDRFAANTVLLPHGIVLGRVPATEVLDVAARYDAGEVDPRLVRGRSALSAPVQGAQHHARLAYAEHGVDALEPRGSEQTPDGTWLIHLDGGARGPVHVEVRERWIASPTPLTCSAGRAASMRTYDLVALDPPAESAIGAGRTHDAAGTGTARP